jgi:PQQ enzyme repeat
MIYCGTNGHVLAIDEENGQERWRTKLKTNSVFNAATSADVTVILVDEWLSPLATGTYGASTPRQARHCGIAICPAWEIASSLCAPRMCPCNMSTSRHRIITPHRTEHKTILSLIWLFPL